ncbi:MAG: hypothetical protein ABSC93_11740 [Bryobacteraceae bacterium]
MCLDTRNAGIQNPQVVPMAKRLGLRSIPATWYAFGTSVSARDTGRDVEAVFLYVPR